MTTDDLDSLIQSEISSQLDSRGLTNVKDIVNKTIVDRSTNPVVPTTPSDANSNALQQGSWFRGAKDSSSYAQGQQGDSYNSPHPSRTSCGSAQAQAINYSYPPQNVDMSEYIRKDSIPCYGCTLK